jgi:hypothetical protein
MRGSAKDKSDDPSLGLQGVRPRNGFPYSLPKIVPKNTIEKILGDAIFIAYPAF